MDFRFEGHNPDTVHFKERNGQVFNVKRIYVRRGFQDKYKLVWQYAYFMDGIIPITIKVTDLGSGERKIVVDGSTHTSYVPNVGSFANFEKTVTMKGHLLGGPCGSELAASANGKRYNSIFGPAPLRGETKITKNSDNDYTVSIHYESPPSNADYAPPLQVGGQDRKTPGFPTWLIFDNYTLEKFRPKNEPVRLNAGMKNGEGAFTDYVVGDGSLHSSIQTFSGKPKIESRFFVQCHQVFMPGRIGCMFDNFDSITSDWYKGGIGSVWPSFYPESTTNNGIANKFACNLYEPYYTLNNGNEVTKRDAMTTAQYYDMKTFFPNSDATMNGTRGYNFNTLFDYFKVPDIPKMAIGAPFFIPTEVGTWKVDVNLRAVVTGFDINYMCFEFGQHFYNEGSSWRNRIKWWDKDGGVHTNILWPRKA